jgi:hypothetical protein
MLLSRFTVSGDTPNTRSRFVDVKTSEKPRLDETTFSFVCRQLFYAGVRSEC